MSFGRYDRGRFHLVLEVAIESLERDRVTRSNIAQRAKESIAVARENDVARFARQSRFRDVADGAPQDSRRIALDENGFQAEARNLHLSYDASLNRRMPRFARV